jgi:prolyl oligopeptidase
VTDPRVAPFHVAKMAARLQASTASHKQDREAADTYAFLLWQTGVKGYQPANPPN